MILNKLSYILICFFCLPLSARFRVISTSPQITELLFQLGRGNNVVATPAFSDYPEAAKKIPLLGPLGFPSIERTVVTDPDWIVTDSEPSPYELAARSLGYSFFRIDLSDLDSLLADSARFLKTIFADATSPAVKSHVVCANAMSGKLGPSATDFLALVWFSPPILFGHTSFLSSVITRAGGKNALPVGWRLAYPQVGEEWLMAHPPSVLYFLAGDESAQRSARDSAVKWWPNRQVKLHPLSQDRFARASFTPLHHLEEIGINPVPKECRALVD